MYHLAFTMPSIVFMTMPQVFLGGHHLRDSDDLRAMHNHGKLIEEDQGSPGLYARRLAVSTAVHRVHEGDTPLLPLAFLPGEMEVSSRFPRHRPWGGEQPPHHAEGGLRDDRALHERERVRHDDLQAKGPGTEGEQRQERTALLPGGALEQGDVIHR